MAAIFLFCFVLFKICFSADDKESLNWTKQNLPSSTNISGAISGYDSMANSIWILSPFNYDHHSNGNIPSMFQYSLNNNKWTLYDQKAYPSPPDYFKEDATNSFIQIDNIIYFISNYHHESDSEDQDQDNYSTYLRGFNMSSHEWSFIKYKLYNTYNSYHQPCLTKTLNNKYLIIIGGSIYNYKDNNYHSSNQIYFYDTKLNKITQTTYINHGIQDCGCSVSNRGYLYTFGGMYDNKYNSQIWKLYVNDIKNINKYKWNSLNNIYLKYKPQKPNILTVNNNIFIIGGKVISSSSSSSHKSHSSSHSSAHSGSSSSSANEHDDHNECSNIVFYLNTDEDMLHNTESLINGNCYGSGLIANGQIYLFGGEETIKYHNNNEYVTDSFYEISNVISPTQIPTNKPTDVPSDQPSSNPSNLPSVIPTDSPSNKPSSIPTIPPTDIPTDSPTLIPSDSPSNKPTASPSNNPTVSPTDKPTDVPTDQPSFNPSDLPSITPTDSPSNQPTASPTNIPTDSPTLIPSNSPSKQPTELPTEITTSTPTDEPSLSPTVTDPDPPTEAHKSYANWVIMGSVIAVVFILIIASIIMGIRKYKQRIAPVPLLNN